MNHLIHKSDTSTINQLSALLISDLPGSKVYVLDALKSMLSVAPIHDILHEDSAANDTIETMIKILSSTREETQAKSASSVAGITLGMTSLPDFPKWPLKDLTTDIPNLE